MTAGLRFWIAAAGTLLALGPAPLAAQEAPPPTTNTPAADSIGPRELQNFSLDGTVTRSADSPARTNAPAPVPSRPATAAAPAPATTRPATTVSSTAPDRTSAQPARETAGPQRSVTVSLPAADAISDTPTASATGQAPTPPPSSEFPPLESAAPSSGHGGVLPWLLALLLVGGGAGYYFYRQRMVPSYASASAHRFVPPAPVPEQKPLQRAPAPAPQQHAPVPAPAAAPPAPGAPAGLVSTRLRPWLDIEFTPARCVVEDDKATIDFDVIVTNSGSTPAHDVLIEASLFNAGPAQDKEIGGFFDHPVAKGDRIPAIPPMRKVQLKSAVSLSRAQIRQFEAAGRRLFVPLIGFNALYRWSGGDGQTSTSYLLGRETKGEKLAPFRLDLGPRVFRGLGARETGIRVRN